MKLNGPISQWPRSGKASTGVVNEDSDSVSVAKSGPYWMSSRRYLSLLMLVSCPYIGMPKVNLQTCWLWTKSNQFSEGPRSGFSNPGMRARVGMQMDSHWHTSNGAQPLFLDIRKKLAFSSAVKQPLAVV